jgi:hypothetical protein
LEWYVETTEDYFLFVDAPTWSESARTEKAISAPGSRYRPLQQLRSYCNASAELH